jgi:hypothetical protein
MRNINNLTKLLPRSATNGQAGAKFTLKLLGSFSDFAPARVEA